RRSRRFCTVTAHLFSRSRIKSNVPSASNRMSSPQEVSPVDTNLTAPVQQALTQRWEPLYRSQLHYLVTWSTRGRRPVLKERHIAAIHELIRSACEDRDYNLVE